MRNVIFFVLLSLSACGNESIEVTQDTMPPAADTLIEADLGVDTHVEPDTQQPESDTRVQDPDLGVDSSPSSDAGAPEPDLGQEPDLTVDRGAPSPDTGVEPDLQTPDVGVDLGVDQQVPEPDQGAPSVTIREGTYGTKWVSLPGGVFTAGTAGDDCVTATTPKTQVYVAPFEIMQFELTKRQRKLLGQTQPWTTCSDLYQCPAGMVSWNEAARVCNALSIKEGLPECYRCFGDCEPWPNRPHTQCGYRLPTWIEFEYAYRAGTQTEFYNGEANPNKCLGYTRANEIAWYDWNSNGEVHEVGWKLPNAWELYDMAGNLEEWTHDSCPGGKIVMGGSYLSTSKQVQAGYAQCETLPNLQSEFRGFRIVRSL